MTIYGADLSNHDWQRGPMAFDAMRAAGLDFVVHKCSDGNRSYRDPYFGRAMQRARAAGFPITGAYHVLWNGNVTAQMDWFMSLLDADAPWWRTEPYLVQLDAEPFGYNGGAPSPATIRQAADYLVAKTGGHINPVVYGPNWVYRDTLRGLPYPLWASAYGTNPVGLHAALYPGDNSSRWAAYSGQTPAILQYGSQTRIGTQSTCDANAYRGTVDQLRQLITGKDADMLDDERKALFAIRDMLGWVDGRVEGLAGLQKPSAGPTKGADLPAVQTIRALSGDLKGLGDTVSNLRAELTALAATVAKLSQPQVTIDAAALAGLPKPPTAAEIATELAKRIGNG